MRTVDLRDFEDGELLALWASVMRVLGDRKIIRSGNNPVGDVAEGLVAATFGVKPEPNSQKGYDVVADGVEYQVKCRRWTSRSKPSHYSVIRDIDKHPFDFLIAVHFDEEFQPTEAWKVSFDAVKQLARPYPHVNGVRLGIIRGDMTSAPGVEPFDLASASKRAAG